MERSNKSLYETDYYQWVQKQKQLLANKQFDQLDLDNLIGEVEDMGSDINTLESRLIVLLLHLLKYDYQTKILNPAMPEPYNCRSWKGTIREQRMQISLLMDRKPHLKHEQDSVLLDAYPRGKKLAISAMNDYLPRKQWLDSDSFPDNSPWSFEQIMREDWLP